MVPYASYEVGIGRGTFMQMKRRPQIPPALICHCSMARAHRAILRWESILYRKQRGPITGPSPHAAGKRPPYPEKPWSGEGMKFIIKTSREV